MFFKWFQSEITKKAKGNGNTIYQTITSIKINNVQHAENNYYIYLK